MGSAPQGAVTAELHRLLGPGPVAGLSEWQLLCRYVRQRDETAFEAIVAWHGPMVLGVCRRLLADGHDVEDAFQATFLVLVRKAESLAERDALGPWLYGVAYRVALKARGLAARRRAREPNIAVTAPSVPSHGDPARFELGMVLDEELSRLPAKYRAPIVLCYFEGLTHEDAASRLRWPVGTVKGRLARARETLKGRLTRRGIALSAAALTASLSQSAVAMVPETLMRTTVAHGTRLATAGAVSASIAMLTEGVLMSMGLTRLKVVSSGLVLAMLATGVGVIAQQSREELPREERAPTAPAARSLEAPAPVPSPASLAVDGSPPGRVAGPIPRLEQAQRDLATEIFRSELRDYLDRGNGDVREMERWSRTIVDASGAAREDRIDALTEHLSRMTALEQAVNRQRARGRGRVHDALAATYFRQDAGLMLERARAGQNDLARRSDPDGQDPDGDLRSRAILEKLEQPVTMSFANETPLEDVLKYIQSATAGANDSRIPIYVDPVGLQQAQKTMTSPISLDLDGVPLKVTLRLALDQLGLTYTVKDGLMTITSEPGSVDARPLKDLVDKAARGQLSSPEIEQLIEPLRVMAEIERLKAERTKMIEALRKNDRERKQPDGSGGGAARRKGRAGGSR